MQLNTKKPKQRDYLKEVRSFFGMDPSQKMKPLKGAEDAVDKLKKRRGRP